MYSLVDICTHAINLLETQAKQEHVHFQFGERNVMTSKWPTFFLYGELDLSISAEPEESSQSPSIYCIIFVITVKINLLINDIILLSTHITKGSSVHRINHWGIL